MFLRRKSYSFTEESRFWTVNVKCSDPLEEIMFLLTFYRYPIRHGDEVVGGVGEVAVEISPELATETAAEGGTMSII